MCKHCFILHIPSNFSLYLLKLDNILHSLTQIDMQPSAVNAMAKTLSQYQAMVTSMLGLKIMSHRLPTYLASASQDIQAEESAHGAYSPL